MVLAYFISSTMSYFRIVSALNKDDKFFIMFSSAMNLINYTEDNGVPLYYTHEDRVKLLHTLPKCEHLSHNSYCRVPRGLHCHDNSAEVTPEDTLGSGPVHGQALWVGWAWYKTRGSAPFLIRCLNISASKKMNPPESMGMNYIDNFTILRVKTILCNPSINVFSSI